MSRFAHPTKFAVPTRMVAVVALAMLACATTATAQSETGQLDRSAKTLRYDVAMDGNSFSFEGATNGAGFPANGTPFIIRGYIYPAGTFDDNGSTSGVNADGSPEFPDQVIGTWYCRGWHLQDADAVSGPVVATTQIFDLDADNPGRKTLVTEGIELADFGVPFSRAITGGTGPRYRKARGTSTQTYVDFNPSFGFNTSFELNVSGGSE